MKEADLFRQYAQEAARSSSEATSQEEKDALMGLACTWAQAALMVSPSPARRDYSHSRKRSAGDHQAQADWDSRL
jgi:hypothetical protein